jgi:type IV pilus assembly protein PilV
VTKSSVACDNGIAGRQPAPDELAKRPPYGGQCTMIVRWAEHGLADNDEYIEDKLRSFTWVFQP